MISLVTEIQMMSYIGSFSPKICGNFFCQNPFSAILRLKHDFFTVSLTSSVIFLSFSYLFFVHQSSPMLLSMSLFFLLLFSPCFSHSSYCRCTCRWSLFRNICYISNFLFFYWTSPLHHYVLSLVIYWLVKLYFKLLLFCLWPKSCCLIFSWICYMYYMSRK